MNLLDETPIPEMDKDLSRVFPFNPVHQDADGTSSTRPGQDRFRQAVAPFTLAVQIASNLARFWCQTDEWECKYTISPAMPPSNSQAPEPAPSSTDQHSLHALITQSMANNATTDLRPLVGRRTYLDRRARAAQASSVPVCSRGDRRYLASVWPFKVYACLC